MPAPRWPLQVISLFLRGLCTNHDSDQPENTFKVQASKVPCSY